VTLLSIGATLSTVRRRRRSLGTPGPTDLA